MHPKDVDGLASSVDTDVGLPCLPRPVCPKTLHHCVCYFGALLYEIHVSNVFTGIVECLFCRMFDSRS